MRVVFAGPSGRTGRATGAALDLLPDLEIVGGVAPSAAGRDLGALWHGRPDGRSVYGDVQAALAELRPDVLVDFTVAHAAEGSLKTALLAGVRPVIGTTGLGDAALREAEALSKQFGLSAAVIANFSVVSALLTEFALRAAPHFDGVELIEMHGPHKLDKPSGTARRLQARLRAEGQDEVPVHSVRLEGFVAHQEVLLGRTGETLSLRHDALDRSCYAAGVRLVALGIMERQGLFRDLAPFLDMLG
ncbi:MAG: 4-hydroxy-tetrahydrodipicolinate reductase [Thermaerobacter sp.]|nr:4-hydroxy-tetrahydrodipicolinate reductase [Thermaerobacter sp.]